jgi:hypothetical protein
VNAILPAFKVPDPTAIRFSPAPDLGIVIAPETVKVIPELIVNEVAVVTVKVIDVQAAAAVTVTLNPPSIVTASPATGIGAPGAPPEVVDHVAVEFQLPLATEKRAAAFAMDAVIKIKPSTKLNLLAVRAAFCKKVRLENE